ncbi:hypothetical protein [Leisingera sp. NJS204]|uniref:hypothetical protein n=1 Tax=Leisingera sp. NJS204 TaxID=2508307 RepID=UPI00197DF345|nr:hypothetical protein [Leisingera sp. NJS204]
MLRPHPALRTLASVISASIIYRRSKRYSDGTRTQPCHFQRIVEHGVPFKVDIYKLEGGDGWSLEVVTGDGTSIVWDDRLEDDRAVFEEAISTIRSEGAVAFASGGSNVVPFKQ